MAIIEAKRRGWLSPGLAEHLPKIIDLYRPRQKAMLAALAQHLPSDFHWSQPEGGMFVWVEGPPEINMAAIYRAAVKRQVAFVPGHFFFAQSERGLNTMRLNFTMPDVLEIDRAIRTLGEIMVENAARPEALPSGGRERCQDASRAGIEVF